MRYQKFFEALNDKNQAMLDRFGYYLSKGREKGFYFDVEYKQDRSSDIEYGLFFYKLIKTNNSNIRNINNFFICYFGDHNFQDYEYAAISTSESELYELLRNWDMQEAILEKYDKMKKKFKSFVIYPFDDGR